MTEPDIDVLEDRGDDRGASFSVAYEYLSFLGEPKDLHVASIRPGCVRGNHYHVERREVIVVIHTDSWSLHWDGGEGSPTSSRRFDGAGVVALAVPPHSAHALRNDGDDALWVLAATDGHYDPDRPDAYRRVVVPTY